MYKILAVQNYTEKNYNVYMVAFYYLSTNKGKAILKLLPLFTHINRLLHSFISLT